LLPDATVYFEAFILYIEDEEERVPTALRVRVGAPIYKIDVVCAHIARPRATVAVRPQLP
jgi:hypothetical protein